MLKSYQRRAFLLLALTALEPASAPARAADPPESLWDILSHADAVAAPTLIGGLPAPVTEPLRPRRLALGPVPGFTLPASQRATTQAEKDSIFAKHKRGGLFGSVGTWFDRLQTSTGTKIKATGHHTLSLRMENISGNSDSYRDEQYFGRGSNGVYNDTDLTVDAQVLKYFHYTTRVSNSLFNNPNDNRVKLDYNTKKMRFEWGDINAGFQGNSLIDFNRYLKGVAMTNTWSSQLKTSLLFSQTKAETRTITIPGNGSSGPYYVYAGQIVEGSERVRVDNRDLVKGADRDYTLDPYTGELRFTKGNVVLPSSTIAVTFETLGYNQSQGSIYGFRTDLTPRGGAHFGLTYVMQTAQGTRGPQTRTDEFGGYETPGSAYVLNAPIDLSKPLIVTLDGVPLSQGHDYIVDATLLNQIRIVQGVPRSTHVRIQYFPLDTNPTPGNRSVLGLDSRLSLGALGSISLESALSGLSIGGGSVGGQAWQIRTDLNPLRNLHTNLTLRDVNPTFSSIQSPGFNRNEKAVEFNSDYSPFRTLRFNLNWQKAKRPSYIGGATQFAVATNGNDDYDQYTLGATYNFARNATLNLSRNSLGTKYVTGGQSANLSDAVSLNYSLRALSFDLGVSHNKSNANQIYTTSLTGVDPTTQSYISNSATLSKHAGVQWQAVRWLNLSGTISDNDIRTVGTGSYTRANARDTQVAARFSLIRNLRMTYSHELSDTGNLSNNFTNGTTTTATTATPPATGVTTGTTTGTTAAGTTAGGTTTGAGTTGGILSNSRAALSRYLVTRDILGGGAAALTAGNTISSAGSLLGGGGNNANLGGYGNYSGFYGGSSGSGYGLSSIAGKSASDRLSLEYQPRQNMTIGLQFDTATSVGDYQYNSNRNNALLNFSWQASERMQMNLSYGVQRVAYNGTIGGSNSNTIQFYMQGHPFGGRLGTQLSWQSLKTGSNLNFNSTTAATTGTTTLGATGLNGSTTTTLTDTGTNLTSLGLRLDYPITSRYSVFIDTVNSDSSGVFGSTESNLRFGLDYSLTQALKFSLGWQIFSRTNKDAENAKYDYKASSLLAEFGLHF